MCSAFLAVEGGDHARDQRQALRRMIKFVVSNYPFPIRGRVGSCGSHPFPSCAGRCLRCSRRSGAARHCLQARLSLHRD
eukprot:6206802-Pleurochrysis_carterae.AAC.2